MVEFNESTKDNPLNYFEDFFSINGQKKAKISFLSWVLPRIDQFYYETDDQEIDYSTLEYDLEKDTFKEYSAGIDHATGEYFENIEEHKYMDYLKHKLVNPQGKVFRDLLKRRIDGCDGSEEEHFVKIKMLGKIDNISSFLDQNNDVPHGDRLKVYVEKLRKHIESVKLTNPPTSKEIDKENSKTRNKAKKQYQVSRLSELSSHVPMESLMNFLKTNKFIRCTQGEVAKLNYYFGIGSSQKKPDSKILWIEDPELLKVLIKKAFNKGPKYQLASKVFNVEGVTEQQIALWGSRHVNKTKDTASKKKLERFIKEKSTVQEKNLDQIESQQDTLMD